MGVFGMIAKVVAAPIQVCSLPVRIVEKTFDFPREDTAFDDAAEAIRELGKELDE